MSQGEAFDGANYGVGWHLLVGISKLARSKWQEIQASLISRQMTSSCINDVISPPQSYIKRSKTVNLHAKRSDTTGRGSILHPQVIDNLNKLILN